MALPLALPMPAKRPDQGVRQVPKNAAEKFRKTLYKLFCKVYSKYSAVLKITVSAANNSMAGKSNRQSKKRPDISRMDNSFYPAADRGIPNKLRKYL